MQTEKPLVSDLTEIVSRGGISVAMCTCNGAAFIEEQIESICLQTLPAMEIVVRDDASTDETVQRLRAAWERCGLARPDATPALRVTVNPQRLGVAQNFSAAISDCAGDFIALCDQDDRWHPDRLERLAARLQAEPDALLLHGNARLIGQAGEDLETTLFEGLEVTAAELGAVCTGGAFEVFLDRNLVTGATAVIRRALLADALPIPSRWLHDEWLGALAAVQGRLVLEKEPLLDYRQHAGNQIGAQKLGVFGRLQRAMALRDGWQAYRRDRAIELLHRLQAMGAKVPSRALQSVQEKISHHAVRASLPVGRLQRIGPVFREWRSGRYARFGRGLSGALKDLIEHA